MYTYSCLVPGEGGWPPLQPLTYTYLPGPLLLPPIQAHSFCSQPPVLSTGDWMVSREYHCFHSPGVSLGAAPPWWAFPQAYAAALCPTFPAPGYPGPSLQAPAEAEAGTAAAENGTPWPEGSSLQAELRWGLVERALGPRLDLPDSVRRELRRAYGTYPHTDVRITFRGGQFLVQAAPRVGEPQYRVHRRLLRPSSSSRGGGSSSGGGGSSTAREAAGHGHRKKRNGLG
ncbi:uncharacterized protein C10orf95 homolog [Molossus molossus]|uniref:Uncharacterized protein n=1 Tax=Molossus molossus TaxID=27622 RepID=A0A7J8DMX9_MOLMO|nr:uncharacterized protein C10orf95 homolog [Molossus molossus]KAF6424574.1 hypothetical protein HJG59_001656 [Molossus molossus]